MPKETPGLGIVAPIRYSAMISNVKRILLRGQAFETRWERRRATFFLLREAAKRPRGGSLVVRAAGGVTEQTSRVCYCGTDSNRMLGADHALAIHSFSRCTGSDPWHRLCPRKQSGGRHGSALSIGAEPPSSVAVPPAASSSHRRRAESVRRDLQLHAAQLPVTEDLDQLVLVGGAGVDQLGHPDRAALRKELRKAGQVDHLEVDVVRFRKPLSFGRRMWRGMCPPSNAGRDVLRALEPFVPRPADLPLEPSPRPTRVFAVLAPGRAAGGAA